MLKKLQNRRKGFTLIELLIVIAIIGIIAALLIPNFLDALQKGKQKRTMGDMKDMGTAMFSWVTDQVGAAAAGQQIQQLNWDDLFTTQEFTDLATILVPAYAAFIPDLDAWGNPYEYGASDSYNDTIPVGVRSTGADADFDTGEYTAGAFYSTDFSQDIVWAGGFFVRWPSGSQVD